MELREQIARAIPTAFGFDPDAMAPPGNIVGHEQPAPLWQRWLKQADSALRWADDGRRVSYFNHSWNGRAEPSMWPEGADLSLVVDKATEVNIGQDGFKVAVHSWPNFGDRAES